MNQNFSDTAYVAGALAPGAWGGCGTGAFCAGEVIRQNDLMMMLQSNQIQNVSRDIAVSTQTLQNTLGLQTMGINNQFNNTNQLITNANGLVLAGISSVKDQQVTANMLNQQQQATNTAAIQAAISGLAQTLNNGFHNVINVQNNQSQMNTQQQLMDSKLAALVNRIH